MNYEFNGKFVTVLRCPCTAEFIKAELVTFMHQLTHMDTGHAWMNGRYKKVDLHDKWIVRTSLVASTGKKVFQSEKFVCGDTAKRAARSTTGLTLFLTLYKPITIALSLWSKTENDITKKVEGIDSRH